MSDAGATHGPRTTDQLVAQLSANPVVVDQVLGSGRTQELDARLTRLADRVEQRTGVPAYVVAVQPPTDAVSEEPSKDLAIVLPRRLGDGIYLVDTGVGAPQVAVRGTTIDETRFSLLQSATLDRVSGDEYGSLLPPAVQGEALLRLVLHQDPRMMRDGPYGESDADRYGRLPDAEVDQVRELAVQIAEPDELNRPGPATSGDIALWGATSGVVVLVVAYLSLRRSWGRTTGPRPAPAGDAVGLRDEERADLAEQARRNLDELARRIAAAPSPLRDAEAMERAVAAREVVEHLLPSDDALTVVGALTLTRVGLGDVRVASRRRASSWRPCFADPRHGEAAGTTSFALDDATLEVPVCERCAADVRAGRPWQPFRPGDRGLPYYESDDVWSRTGFGALDADVARTVLRERAGRS